MRYAILAAILFAAPVNAASKEEELAAAAFAFEVAKLKAKPVVPVKTTCGCAFTGDCTCWAGECTCSACRPAAPVKPSLNIDPSHTCAKCGTYANVVKQEANGMHSHQCPSCGNEWWHSDPGAAAPITLSSSPCANGNCASPQTVTRWRLFR